MSVSGRVRGGAHPASADQPRAKNLAMPSSRKNVDDLHRLLAELVLLRGPDRWTPALLAERFGISEKTARRDIIKLKGTGFNVRFDRARRSYRLADDSFLPPVHLSLEECLALVVMCEDIAGRGQIGLLHAALSALSKIEAQLPRALKTRLDAVMDHIAVRLAPSGCGDCEAEVFRQVQAAIAEQTALTCVYQAPGRAREPAPFAFEPYALWYGVRAWYAIGKHKRRGEVVALKLRRFVAVEPTREKFVRPANFTVESYLGNAWQMIPGDRDYKVELQFDSDFGETAADTKWHSTQRVVYHTDGTVSLHFTVSGLQEIAWWVLSMGRHCRVIRPRELARRVRAEAAATVKMHSGRLGARARGA